MLLYEPVYTSAMSTSSAKTPAMIKPRARAARMTKGIWSSWRTPCFHRGKCSCVWPVASSTVCVSHLNSERVTFVVLMLRTFQRMLRSTCWIFQYSRKTVHQMQVTMPYVSEYLLRRSQATTPAKAGKTRKTR
jgi:hypothetical protein